VDDLESAVSLAKQITPAGQACLLSPAAASYGYFKNFEERGDVFRQLVLGK
jgi:UDP-N-acetylmuramoylalanine--D-glutamate ligase